MKRVRAVAVRLGRQVLVVMGLVLSCACDENDDLLTAECVDGLEKFSRQEQPEYEADIVPILQKYCNSPVCHGGGYGKSEGELWLGPMDGAYTREELDFTYESLINVRSHVASNLAIVRPHEPAHSFLMLKVTGCHEHEQYGCQHNEPSIPCGEAMPPGVRRGLDEEELATIYTWIENGAPK